MVKARFKLVVTCCFIMVTIHLVQIVFSVNFGAFGIMPSDLYSIPKIFSAPWIHGSWSHLMNNLVGFSIFSLLCLIRGIRFYVLSSLIIIVLTGLLVWLFARGGSYHIGASGWIFGLWSLSIALAWFQRSFLNIVIAIFVAFFYGGMVWGVLPTNPYISFESHLFGAISGVIAAYLMTRPKTSQSMSVRRNSAK